MQMIFPVFASMACAEVKAKVLPILITLFKGRMIDEIGIVIRRQDRNKIYLEIMSICCPGAASIPSAEHSST